MREIVIDLKDMNDTKEVYEKKISPLYSAFIYFLVFCFGLSFIYFYFGKIEIVAKANGVIRPNDEVSTVSPLVGGKVTGVFYSDGEVVKEGQKLLSIDTTESEISLEALRKQEQKLGEDRLYVEKFIDGIKKDTNPFDKDSKEEEYNYFVQFEQYKLDKKSTFISSDFNEKKAVSSIEACKKQKVDMEYQIKGLEAYKNSIETGKDMLKDFPEYENMYLSYKNLITSIDNDYNSKKADIDFNVSTASNDYYINYYQDRVSEYEDLVDSIKSGESKFNDDDTSEAKLFYKQYSYEAEGYEKAIDRNGDTPGLENTARSDDNLKRLEGYKLFRQSVESGNDCFSMDSPSYEYHYLYDNYKNEYDKIDENVALLQTEYENLINNEERNESVNMDEFVANLSKQITARDNYKATTISNIDNVILQIQTVELSSGDDTDKETSEQALNTYKSKSLATYTGTLDEYKQKLDEAKLQKDGIKSKELLYADLDKTYQNTKRQRYLSTITEIDNSIQSLKTKLIQIEADLDMNEVISQMYKDSKGEDGTYVDVSKVKIDKLSELLSRKKQIETELDELKTQIKQTEEQISAGNITASRDGIINVSQEISAGDVIPSGSLIGTVIPAGSNEFKVQIYVDNSSIGNLKEGDDIKYSIMSLPSSEYGYVNGKVVSISKDTLVMDGKNSGYYLVTGTIDAEKLKDHNGNEGEIAIGMQVEAKIVTEKKRIISYILEKINIT
ncbi:HlyD family efflux transporter periplasmic adaptor subunit [Butyrivibrio sp. INlla21]|uniref:HlyD family efflux transporter periplasmic adaptor subunit n=1 Tax=Butyrivibrio sp. INlla21 TaxID=1520811 RepID=UPI0008F02707|nr:HlyD family efflux transporter periplasmic adaptor subunit [Butyrivibrio sp. INlla21]SFU83750.1 Biotin-lipoyl like [Butyrivibrio sp. INlla21]